MSLKDKLADMEHGLVQERFQYLLRAIVTTMCANNTLSINEYEDLARQLLGNDAFLLFQMDKLIAVGSVSNSCTTSQATPRLSWR